MSSEAKFGYINEKKTIEIETAQKASVERKKKILKGEFHYFTVVLTLTLVFQHDLL